MGCLSGEWDETELNIFMKEPAYNIMMMSTFSGLTVPEGQKEERIMVNGEIVKFKYSSIVANHYRYRRAVDNNNDLRHDGGIKSQIGLESVRGTTWWPIQVFAFFVACTEVDAYLAMKYFLKTDETFMNFREKRRRCC